MNTEDRALLRIAELFEELNLSKNDGWLTALKLCASIAVTSGMTLEQTLERVGKMYKMFAEVAPTLAEETQP